MTGLEIERIRQEKRMTVQQLADICGYTHNGMWKVLRGWTNVSPRMILALKAAKLIK